MYSWILTGFAVAIFSLIWIWVDHYMWEFKEERKEERLGYEWAKEKHKIGVSIIVIRRVCHTTESTPRYRGIMRFLEEVQCDQ